MNADDIERLIAERSLARGLRVKSTESHYKAFYALQRLDDTQLREYAARFDELRATRHASIYEPDEDEPEIAARVTEALATLRQALPGIRAWLTRERPALAPALACPPSREACAAPVTQGCHGVRWCAVQSRDVHRAGSDRDPAWSPPLRAIDATDAFAAPAGYSRGRKMSFVASVNANSSSAAVAPR